MTKIIIYIFLSIILMSSCTVPYSRDFEEVIGDPFPGNAIIKSNHRSPSDVHGDYGSYFEVELEDKFVTELEGKLLIKGFSSTLEEPSLGEFDNASKHFKSASIVGRYKYSSKSKYYYVAILSDKKTIIIIRSSW